MKRKLLLIGGGGHCSSVLDSLLGHNQYETIGIIDLKQNIGKTINDVPVIGTDEDLDKLYKQGYLNAFISIGSVENSILRFNIFNKLKQIGFILPNIIDTSSNVSKNAELKEGIFVGKNVIINANTKVGSCSIINTGSIIEHDCIIDDYVHIAPGSVICGNVSIGKSTHIGANSTIKQGKKIGSNVMVGMGSVVLHDILDFSTEYGNPSKKR